MCRKVAASDKQYSCDLGTPKPARLDMEGAYSGHITLPAPWVPAEGGLQSHVPFLMLN